MSSIMTTRPILFQGAMVRALLDGSKTQTRRIVKPQFDNDAEPAEMGATNERGHQISGHSGMWWDECAGNHEAAVRCPYGQPGDQLWVRETFYCDNAFYPDGVGVSCMWRVVDGARVAIPVEEQRAQMLAEDMYYRADGDPEFEGAEGPTPWRPSIHMPRWASRITLEITGVRVERLHAINEVDAIAEGAAWAACGSPQEGSHKAGYAQLWESINGSGRGMKTHGSGSLSSRW